MKKIKSLFAAIIFSAITLTSCGNMSISLGNYTFHHIHFTNMTEEKCATIESWHNNDRGIEVATREYGSLFLSEGTYILVEDSNNCPFCKES